MAALTLIVLVIALAIAAGLLFALGTTLVGAVLVVLLLVGGFVWFVLLLSSRRTTSDVVRETGGERPELLGPGGPDDPDR